MLLTVTTYSWASRPVDIGNGAVSDPTAGDTFLRHAVPVLCAQQRGNVVWMLDERGNRHQGTITSLGEKLTDNRIVSTLSAW